MCTRASMRFAHCFLKAVCNQLRQSFAFWQFQCHKFSQSLCSPFCFVERQSKLVNTNYVHHLFILNYRSQVAASVERKTDSLYRENGRGGGCFSINPSTLFINLNVLVACCLCECLSHLLLQKESQSAKQPHRK